MKRYLYRKEDVILETALPSPEPGRELLAVLGEDRLYALRGDCVIGNAPPCQLVAKSGGSLPFVRRTANSVCDAGTSSRNGRRFSRAVCGFGAG